MPFKSERQRRHMRAQRPQVAQQWAQEAKVKNQGSGRREMLKKFARKQRG